MALGLSIALASGPALAFGGGGGSAGPAGGASVGAAPAQAPAMAQKPAKPAANLKVCKRGLAWSVKKKACVKATSGLLPDQELLRQGRLLALSGRYHHAIAVLDAVSNKTRDPMVFTMLGYSHRKLGQTQTGMKYYHRALAVDPNSLNTHEYLGEGYAQLGQITEAKAELATVAKLCGNTTCEQYHDLADAIAGKPDD